MLKDSLQGALNEQVRHEIYSGHVYLSMSAWFESRSLPGFAAWMRTQYEEELMHALKIFDFINERGGRAEVGAIEAPPRDWASPLAAFEAAYENEKKVSGMINDLYDLASTENDHASQVMLQWFITEQVEEEAITSLAVDQLRLAGEDGSALLMLDQQYGARQGDGGGE